MRKILNAVFIPVVLILMFFNDSLIARKQLNAFSDEISQLAEKVNKSVVQIIVTSYSPGYGQGSQNLVKVRGSGSGFIVDPSGYIVTNTHVVDGVKEGDPIVVHLEREGTLQYLEFVYED